MVSVMAGGNVLAWPTIKNTELLQRGMCDPASDHTGHCDGCTVMADSRIIASRRINIKRHHASKSKGSHGFDEFEKVMDHVFAHWL